MKVTNLKWIGALCTLLFAMVLLGLVVTACKTDTASSEPSTWKVTIDQNYGTGLDVLTYDVKDGETLNESALQGKPAIQNMILAGYTYSEGNFVLGSTPVKGNITIKANWTRDTSIDCSSYTNPGTQLLVYAKTADSLGIACALNANAKITDTDSNGYTALLLASNLGNKVLVGGVLVPSEDNLPAIQFLLANGASLKERDTTYGRTALLNAAQNGKLALVKYLIANGASFAEKDSDGSTALLLAPVVDTFEVVKYLLAIGEPVSEKSNTGVTVLHRAASTGKIDTVKYLVAAGASVTAKNNDGYTPMLYAAEGGYIEVTQYLLANGATVSEKTNEGMTALMLAAKSASNWNTDDSKNIIKYLVGAGVDVKTTATGGTYVGQTALGIAQSNANKNDPNYNTMLLYLQSL